MFYNKVIVFGFNHINALGVVRSLGEKGIKPICILYGPNKGLVYSSKYPLKVIKITDSFEGLKIITEKYSKEKIKPIIICTNDPTASIIDKNYLLLKDKFYLPNAKTEGRITFLMNKSNIGNLAKQFGFNIPKSVIINKENLVTKNIEYPCFTKSVTTIKGGKKNTFLCDNENELTNALDKITGNEILIQQYINKKNEICLQGLSIEAGRQIFIPFVEKFFRFTKHTFGGYVYFTKFENQKKEFIEKIHKLIKVTEYSGLFSVEFLVDDHDNLFFTEINFRHDGFSYFTTTGGANLPYIWCKSVVNNNIEVNNMSLKEYFVGMNEPTDFFQFVRTRKISFIKWIIQCVKADSHLLYNKKDLGPLLHSLKSYFIIAWNKYLLRRK